MREEDGCIGINDLRIPTMIVVQFEQKDMVAPRPETSADAGHSKESHFDSVGHMQVGVGQGNAFDLRGRKWPLEVRVVEGHMQKGVGNEATEDSQKKVLNEMVAEGDRKSVV